MAVKSVYAIELIRMINMSRFIGVLAAERSGYKLSIATAQLALQKGSVSFISLTGRRLDALILIISKESCKKLSNWKMMI